MLRNGRRMMRLSVGTGIAAAILIRVVTQLPRDLMGFLMGATLTTMLITIVFVVYGQISDDEGCESFDG